MSLTPSSRRRRKGARRGSVALEFGLVIPVFALLITAGADIMLWLRAWFRVERVASEVATVTSQFSALTTADINAIFAAGQQVAGGIPVTGSTGGQIISLVNNTGAGNRIAWQRVTGTFTSKIGTTGGVATLPAAFTVPLGQTVLVAEAFTRRSVWVFALQTMSGNSNPNEVYSYAIVRPRSAQLLTPPA